MLSRLDTVVEAVRAALEDYDLTGATRTLMGFVLDDVSNWYVRRSRDRFWATRVGDAEPVHSPEAFATLYEVLTTVSLLLAPFAPFLPDWLHRQLADGASAHLTDFPRSAGREDIDLERAMSDVRQLAALGRAAREEAGIRVRQPLRTLTGPGAGLDSGRRAEREKGCVP
jgi:isoleucyl-tRNA synthetase